MASTCSFTCKLPLILLLLFVLIFASGLQSCYGQQTFGFDVHHRYSDPIRQIFPLDNFPEKGTFDYYKALTHRDHIIRGRRLGSTSTQDPILTFEGGNTTYSVADSGYLHYANVSLGTPSLSFFVALDTGSDVFWVPCDCVSCAHSWELSNGTVVDLNIYSPSASSTSKTVPCNSSMCELQDQCNLLGSSSCPYEVAYVSALTSTSGYLVEDVLHLTTDYSNPQAVDARITFGCGKVQTGSFLTTAAPNGLFGLGMDKVSVPSVLSSSGLTANSFSMCFGSDGIGRINFGDKGSSDQAETPFNTMTSNPTYNISVTQITVGTNVTDVSFTAIFDSGTSYTYLKDPAYTSIAESFNAQVKDKRRSYDPNSPFDYCYDPSSTSENITVPPLNLTMGGGSQYLVYDPIVYVNSSTISYYCLALTKSTDLNIIGQNFMTEYLIVFDREKSVLGWKQSNCYDTKYYSTTTTTQTNSTVVPPATAADPPQSGVKSGSDSSSAASSASIGWPPLLNPRNCCFLISLLALFALI
ncbi:aspartyl protease family protein 1-like isoform X2 [Telopea speciosissima]|uniref:aspartyl protease family protein 1-like isoform X2 n=1 Tax=Telopea speciosissima TaxID=54955 RepID=UPI001CC68100|nr:aspartyl protease family protein 1-like isoform X2 [Telopea speciosissima]